MQWLQTSTSLTAMQTRSELVATSLASQYNHCILLNKHKKDTLLPMLIQKN